MARQPKVTIHEAGSPADPTPAPAGPQSPSEALIQNGIQPKLLTDGRGRTLSVRKPGVLAQFQLIEALGEVASNQAYVQMVMPLIYLGAIDDQPIFPPRNKLQIEGLITQLGDEGLNTLMAWYMEEIVAPTLDAMKEAEQRAALKN